jgi:N-acetylmuramoyl-L-alanine amidase
MVLNRDSIAIWGTVGTGGASLRVNDRKVVVEPNGAFADFLPLPRADTAVLDFVAKSGGDTRRRTIRILRRNPTAGASTARDALVPQERWVVLRRVRSDTADSATHARPIYSRWTPDGSLAVPLEQESRAFSDLRTANSIRLRLAPDVFVWVPAAEAAQTHASPLPPPRLAGLNIAADSNETTVTIPATERLNSSVEFAVDRLHWTIWAEHPGGLLPAQDTVVGTVQQIADRHDGPGRITLEVQLTEKPLGWKSEWREGLLVLRIRSQRPLRSGLRGLIVAVDAGHPPGGTIGPSGYTEAEMTLAVARAASRRLEALGAHPVLLREGDAPVSLDERIARAERAGAHVLVSIHGNSPGPGRPPWAVLGTQTIWLRPMSQPLANALLREVRTALAQPPLGAHREDFALLRPTWFPAVLVEGTGLVLPEREAYLRTPAGIAAYADGIVSGLEFWLRASGASRGQLKAQYHVPTTAWRARPDARSVLPRRSSTPCRTSSATDSSMAALRRRISAARSPRVARLPA